MHRIVNSSTLTSGIPPRRLSGQDSSVLSDAQAVQVYGAIAYYLDNEKTVNDYIVALAKNGGPTVIESGPVCAPGGFAPSDDF
jgi:hypothetical protein